ncbi:hypothetical protein [Pseudoduganella sp. OTU4001]|uniref:hypothetical protein n=1 Tax=Pseudoduganella sp. OTU4001 TaxID=3043854 RepID=UPI00313C04C3
MVNMHFVVLGILVAAGLLLHHFGYITAGPKLGKRQRIAVGIMLLVVVSVAVLNNLERIL